VISLICEFRYKD